MVKLFLFTFMGIEPEAVKEMRISVATKEGRGNSRAGMSRQ